MDSAPGIVIIGIGNEFRRDDGVGLEVARRLRETAPSGARVICGVGDEYALISAWQGCGRAYVIDCSVSGAAPGTIHQFDGRGGPIPGEILSSCSTHALDLAKAVELSRVLGGLPGELTVFAIEGSDFSHGSGLTTAVEAAASKVAGLIARACR